MIPRWVWNGKARRLLTEEAAALARERLDVLKRTTDAELLSGQFDFTEKLKLTDATVRCIKWSHVNDDGSRLFVVDVWGDGFWGGGRIVVGGVVLADGGRRALTGADLGDDHMPVL